jgi:hypothetical protein
VAAEVAGSVRTIAGALLRSTRCRAGTSGQGPERRA